MTITVDWHLFVGPTVAVVETPLWQHEALTDADDWPRLVLPPPLVDRALTPMRRKTDGGPR